MFDIADIFILLTFSLCLHISFACLYGALMLCTCDTYCCKQGHWEFPFRKL